MKIQQNFDIILSYFHNINVYSVIVIFSTRKSFELIGYKLQIFFISKSCRAESVTFSKSSTLICTRGPWSLAALPPVMGAVGFADFRST